MKMIGCNADAKRRVLKSMCRKSCAENHRHKSLFKISAYTALRRSGSPGFVRRVAPDWWSDHALLMHAARGRGRAAAAQPEGLRLWAHGAASSLSHGSTSILSLLLAPHAQRHSAVYAEIVNRL
jgi:hypothetical protein